MSDKIKHLKPGDIIWAPRSLNCNIEPGTPYEYWTIISNIPNTDYPKGYYNNIEMTNQTETVLVLANAEYELCITYDSDDDLDKE